MPSKVQKPRLPKKKDKFSIRPGDVDVNGMAYPACLLDTSHTAYNLYITRNAYNKGISDLDKCQFCIDGNEECIFMAGNAMRRCALCRAAGRSTAECDSAIIKLSLSCQRPVGAPWNKRLRKPAFIPAKTQANKQILLSQNEPKEATQFDKRSIIVLSTPTAQTLVSPRSPKEFEQLLAGLEFEVARLENATAYLEEKMGQMITTIAGQEKELTELLELIYNNNVGKSESLS